ncbi:MAG: PspA/IM30 family protein [Bacteroidota bacterium]
MSFFKKLFGKGEEAPKDKYQEYTDGVQAGIGEMRKKLEGRLVELADAKKVSLAADKEMATLEQQARSINDSLEALTQKVLDGEVEPEEAERRKSHGLEQLKRLESKREQATKHANSLKDQVSQLTGVVDKLKDSIAQFEQELSTLKSRARLSGAKRDITQSVMDAEVGSTATLLEQMKARIEQDEAVADAFEELNEDDEFKR